MKRANVGACRYGQEEGVHEGERQDLDGKGGLRGRFGEGWAASKICRNEAVLLMSMRLPSGFQDANTMRQ